MPTIKTYRKVGAFYIAWEEDLSIPIFSGFFNLSEMWRVASYSLG
jgi:hypothetical protein